MGGSVSRLELAQDHEAGSNELVPISAGNNLLGKILVELSKPLAARQDASVELRFYGKEKVLMNRRKSKTTYYNDQSYPKNSAERPIVSTNLQWPNFPTNEEETGAVVPVGAYVFPFCIELPKTLPSSTYFPKDNRKRSKLRFRIQYKLAASVVVDSKALKMDTKYIWIRAATPPPQEPVPCLLEPVAHQIQGGGLFTKNKGTFLFGAAIDDCRVTNTIQLHLACRNDSSVEIQSVVIRVLEKLTWGTAAIHNVDPATGIVRKSATLEQTATKTIFILRDIQLPGLAKERKSMLASVLHGIVGSPQERLQRQVYEDVVSGQNKICIELPIGARESYAGQLLQIEHLVRIEFQTDLMKHPILDIPITILGSGRAASEGTVPNQSNGAGEAYRIPPPMEELTPAETGVVTYEAEIVNDDSAKKQSSAVPIVSARPLEIPSNAVIASTASTDADVIVLGGDAILNDHHSSHRQLSDLAVLPPPTVVSLSSLLSEMRSCLNDYDMISEKVQNEEWTRLFQSLSPDDFGSVISCVHVASDQPRVAVLLASHMQLTCQHVVSALRNTSNPHRATMAQRLAPLCVDIGSNHEVVRAALTEWELTVVDKALNDAVSATRQSGSKRKP